MKIALLANWGGTIHGVRWANSLAERGHDVHLISAHRSGEPLDPGVTLHLLPLRPPIVYFAGGPWVRAILQNINPDFLHVHRASGYGTLGRLTNYHPRILSVWGADVYDVPLRSSWEKKLVVGNLASADWVCSTSHTMADQVRRLCPDVGNLTITPFGIDTEKFRPMPEARAPMHLTIGTVKTLEDRYGVDLLIRGFAAARQALTKSDPETASLLRLVIAGSGSRRASLGVLADELGVSDVTEFTGRVPHAEVPCTLNRLDIYVAASRSDSESFGVAVLEASACAVPVVAANVGGLSEVVVDGETGFLVKRESAEAVTEALLTLICDARLRAEMGRNGRRFVVEKYDWQQSVTTMEEVYQSLLGRPQLVAG